jgi:small subunit ribosomal protein S20
MGGDRGPFWAVGRAAGSLGGCVSCPLSARHTPKKSPGTDFVRFPRGPVPEPEKAQSVANIKSQIKRIKTNEKARLRNKAVKSSLKTAIRKAREAAAAGDQEKAVEYQRAAARQLDKAVSKGVIHKNQAANKKSALASKVASLKG